MVWFSEWLACFCWDNIFSEYPSYVYDWYFHKILSIQRKRFRFSWSFDRRSRLLPILKDWWTMKVLEVVDTNLIATMLVDLESQRNNHYYIQKYMFVERLADIVIIRFYRSVGKLYVNSASERERTYACLLTECTYKNKLWQQGFYYFRSIDALQTSLVNISYF